MKFESELKKQTDTLAFIESGTPNQAEAGVRQLGELLGFKAIRPDNDEGTGPDVLWLDEAQCRMIGFELKTEKEGSSTYFKREINQGHDHLEWMIQNYGNYTSLGLLFVGPDISVDERANPSEKMGICLPRNLISLKNRIIALIEDLRRKTPIERLSLISNIAEEDQWNMDCLVSELWSQDMINQ